MRVKQSRRLLPGRLSCEHICVWRFEQTPMCLLRSHDCLSFLFSLPLKTRCPSSHSSHHGQERKGYSNPHWEQELHSWLWNIFTLRNKDLTIRSLEKKRRKKSCLDYLAKWGWILRFEHVYAWAIEYVHMHDCVWLGSPLLEPAVWAQWSSLGPKLYKEAFS